MLEPSPLNYWHFSAGTKYVPAYKPEIKISGIVWKISGIVDFTLLTDSMARRKTCLVEDVL